MGVKGIARVLLVAAIVAMVVAAGAAGGRTEHAALSIAPASGTWTTKAAMPTPRAEPSIAVLGGQVHVVGGHLTSQLSTHEAYDPVANTWSSRAARPQVGASRAHGVINGILYEAGGVNCCVEVNNTWAYDPATNSWSAKASMPTTRQAAMGGVVSDKLIVTGGVAGGTFYASTEVYDPASNTWATKAPMPTARDRAAAGVIDGVFYVAGGRNASGALAMLEAYDLATDTWTTKTPMPTARHTPAAAVHGGRLYVIGGHDGSGPLNVVEVYDPATNSWSTETAMPTARAQLVAATVDGTIYAIGGDNGSGRVGTNEAFTPSAASPPLPPGARPPATSVVATIPVPSTGIGLAYLDVNPAASRLYATHNGQPGEAAVIDTSTNSVIRRVALGVNTERVAVDELTGRVYVTQWSVGPSGNSAGLAVLNTDGDILQTLTSAGNAAGLGVDPVAQRAFFASGYPAVSTNTLTAVDTSTMPHTVVGSTELDPPPVITWDVTANPVRGDLYAVGIPGNSVAIHDSSTLARTGTIGVGTDPINLDVHVGGDWLYVANSGSDSVSVVDASTNHVVTTIPVGDRPDGIALDSVSNHVYVANFESDTISVIDAATNSVVATVPVGDGPKGVAVDPVTGRVYVANYYDNTISVLEVPPPPLPPNVVINTNDGGPGSLRAAIEFANATPGPNQILFAIPATDPGFTGQWFTIRPMSSLPPLTDDGTSIDGSTQTTFTGDTNANGPEIELNGSLAGPAIGLLVQSSGNRIHALTVNGFQAAGGGTGLGIQLRATDNVLTGSYLGTDPTGTSAVPNGEAGVSVGHDAHGNRVGGTAPGDRNVISGNADYGVILLHDAQTTVVQGNYIGTNAAGTASIPNGSNTGPGMHVQGSNNTIRGNVISGNDGPGIGIFMPTATGNVIAGNFIGTNAAGTGAIPNSDGVAGGGTANTIGGQNPADRNVISGNENQGVTFFAGASNVVEGNYIGTDASGMAAVPNGRGGVFVNGAPGTLVRGNVLSGNIGDGLTLHGEPGENRVLGNFIGTNAAGTAALPNRRFEPGGGGGFGIVVRNAGNVIGGSAPEARNVISGNEQAGIQIGSPPQFGDPLAARNNVVEGNYIGTDVTGSADLGNDTVGVFVFGPDNTIRGNVVSGNPTGIGLALEQATGNLVAGNYVGTDASGMAALPNQMGVSIHTASDNTIGGTSAGARNVISGNTHSGVSIDRGSNNLIQGNYIGTDATGNAAIGNEFGVSVNGGPDAAAVDNRVADNTVSGNRLFGVFVGEAAPGTRIEGNRIGTNAAGTAALGNGLGSADCCGGGVRVNEGGADVTIGGATPAERNIISGNHVGVGVIGATRILIQGNYIGTNADGTAAIPNAQTGEAGVRFFTDVTDSRIVDNLISGNGGPGVSFSAAPGQVTSANMIQSNRIGTNADGTGALPNGAAGIVLFSEGVSSTTIGDAGAGNVIAHNGAAGVLVVGATANLIAENTIRDNGGAGVRVFGDTAVENAIRRNSMAGNGSLGIDLGADGVTPNDPDDADTGPNELMNFPELLSAVATPAGLRVTGRIDTASPTSVTIELFANRVPSPGGDPSGHGEGAEFLGTATPGPGGAFTVVLPNVPVGTLISATATDAGGNTSEFAENATARGPGGP